MDEFADCRATVEALSDEYEACESAQYAVSTNVWEQCTRYIMSLRKKRVVITL